MRPEATNRGPLEATPMRAREIITTILVLVVLGTGHASNNLASALGRADFGVSRKADDRRPAALS